MASNTQQTVPAGCTTGIFYLILAGLAFGMNWQDLMDHASKHNLDVEYATVYPKLGGWLRILDRDTFLRAFEVFSHAEIKGKPILADSRNDKLPVMLRFPPPPLRQSLSLSVQHSTPTTMTPASPQSTCTNDYFGDFTPRYPTVAYMQSSPGDFPQQLYFAAPATMIHMGPIYAFHLDSKAIMPQYMAYTQSQLQVESPPAWHDGNGSHGSPAYTPNEGAGWPNYITTPVRKGSYSETPYYPYTKPKAKGKHWAHTLDVLPNRSQSRTPVVVDGSRSSHDHKSRNSR